jgi:hypothetical protein
VAWRIEWTPAAAVEAEAEAAKYALKREGLGDRFLDEIDATIERITEGPEHGHLAPKNKSEAMARLPRFPALFPSEIAAAEVAEPCATGVPNLVVIPGAHGAHGATGRASLRTKKAAASGEMRPPSAGSGSESRRTRTFKPAD